MPVALARQPKARVPRALCRRVRSGSAAGHWRGAHGALRRLRGQLGGLLHETLACALVLPHARPNHEHCAQVTASEHGGVSSAMISRCHMCMYAQRGAVPC